VEGIGIDRYEDGKLAATMEVLAEQLVWEA